jgi:transcriptional regulator with XRE-family HTH domain
MDNPAEIVGRTLAANLRAARQERGWRLEDLAGRCGVSRNMLQQIEAGRTNPSVATLAKISATLGVPIGRMLEPPEELGRVSRGADAKAHIRGASGRSEVRLLINDGRAPFTELWDFRIEPGDVISSDGHPSGTRELLFVTTGTVTVTVGGATFQAGPGDALGMRGDRRHSYANHGPSTTRFAVTVVYAGRQDPRYEEMTPA